MNHPPGHEHHPGQEHSPGKQREPGTEHEPATMYRRAGGVLWRQGPDRILVHRVRATPEETAADLVGPVALVWLALDEPGTLDHVRLRLAEADLVIDDVAAEIDRLLDQDLIEATAIRTTGTGRTGTEPTDTEPTDTEPTDTEPTDTERAESSS